MKKYRLGDIAKVDISGIDKKTKESETAVRLCNFTDVYYNWAITKNMYNGLMKATASESDIESFLLQKGMVVITKDSETRDDIGIAAYIADDFEDVVLGYHCALIVPKEDIPEEERIYGKYLNALLHTKYAQKYFSNNATGSGQRYTLSKESIEDMPVYLPTYKEQVRIGDYLSDLDKKIDVNNQIKTELEVMAKQMYDYWFVQFDFPNEEGKPYNSSGGKMVWNETLKRNIPINWHSGNLFEIAQFTNGLACQKYRPQPGEIPLPVIKIKEMRDGFKADTEEMTPNIPDSAKVYNGDILFSWSASLEVMLWAYGKGGLNQHIFKVTSANEYPKTFFYYQLLDYVSIFKKIAEARKTTMGHITQDHLQQSLIAIPDDVNVAKLFNSKISPIFDLIVKAQEDNSNIQSLRDFILPLLINGQYTIKD